MKPSRRSNDGCHSKLLHAVRFSFWPEHVFGYFSSTRKLDLERIFGSFEITRVGWDKKKKKKKKEKKKKKRKKEKEKKSTIKTIIICLE